MDSNNILGAIFAGVIFALVLITFLKVSNVQANINNINQKLEILLEEPINDK